MAMFVCGNLLVSLFLPNQKVFYKDIHVLKDPGKRGVTENKPSAAQGFAVFGCFKEGDTSNGVKDSTGSWPRGYASINLRKEGC